MASRGVNKVILIGNLGQDPEIRQSQSGGTIANLNIATGEAWKDQQGQLQERTEWHRVVMFGRTAEIARDYLRKGSKIYCDGRLRTRKWQDNNGQDRYTTEIVVQEFQMLGSKSGDDDQRGQYDARNNAPANPAPVHPVTGTPPIDFDDDLPF